MYLFRFHGGEVLQLIHLSALFNLNAEPMGDSNSDAVIEQWLEQERTTPFDLTIGVLLVNNPATTSPLKVGWG